MTRANIKQLKYAISKQYELIEKYENQEIDTDFWNNIIADADAITKQFKSELSQQYMAEKTNEVIEAFSSTQRGVKIE